MDMSSGAAGEPGPNESASLGLMDSLSPECTPLKHTYDRCFNAWFKDYLDASSEYIDTNATPAKGSWTSGFPRLSSGSNRMAQHLAVLRERYEHDCGKLFAEYQACVKVRILFSIIHFTDHL